MSLSVEDPWEIEDLLARYCMALDTKNWDDFPNILLPVVTWDYSDDRPYRRCPLTERTQHSRLCVQKFIHL
jgi:hypothetical protein